MPPDAVDDLPAEAWLTALAGLPHMGPRRLLAITLLLSPRQAWEVVASGTVLHHPGLVGRMGRDPHGLAQGWSRAAAEIDVSARWEAHRGLAVLGRGHPDYPGPLATDLEPPAVVFLRGAGAALHGPRVAVVGTRRCTRGGFETARELGHDLASAGVRVISGLALGVDGAAHRGALDAGPGAAPPIGVVASGLDVVYPRSHRSLWHEVVEAGGLLMSECPLGTRPDAWRFPARNRIVAAMADVLVVVESPAKGGSLYTADEAQRRDIPVYAVPGSVRSPASAGTNKLLFDGAEIVRDAADVLGAMGLERPRSRARAERPLPSVDGQLVLAALGWEAGSLDTLAIRSGLDLGPLSVATAELEADGWITRQGLWFERAGSA